jgi:Raf kinase inhibitor-like YbhB/YbcL family protein
MMPSMRRIALAVLVLLAGCGGGQKLDEAPPAAPAVLQVRSTDFPPNGRIPVANTCDGAGARPALAWTGVPAGARELALVVVDPDAGGFVHWTLYGLPPRTTSLAVRGLPAGAKEGENSFGDRGWGAPCPPKGKGTHRYEFALYWLRSASGLDAGAKPKAVVDAIGERAGGGGVLVGRYGR